VFYQEVPEYYEVKDPPFGCVILLRDKKATEFPDSYGADQLKARTFDSSGFRRLLNFARCYITIAEHKCNTLHEFIIQKDVVVAQKQPCIRHQRCTCGKCFPQSRKSIKVLQAERDNRLGQAEHLVQQAEQLCSTLYWMLEDTGCSDEARAFTTYTLQALNHCRSIVDGAAAVKQTFRRCR